MIPVLTVQGLQKSPDGSKTFVLCDRLGRGNIRKSEGLILQARNRNRGQRGSHGDYDSHNPPPPTKFIHMPAFNKSHSYSTLGKVLVITNKDSFFCMVCLPCYNKLISSACNHQNCPIKNSTGIVFKFPKAILAGSKAPLGNLEAVPHPGPRQPAYNLHTGAGRSFLFLLKNGSTQVDLQGH